MGAETLTWHSEIEAGVLTTRGHFRSSLDTQQFLNFWVFGNKLYVRLTKPKNDLTNTGLG